MTPTPEDINLDPDNGPWEVDEAKQVISDYRAITRSSNCKCIDHAGHTQQLLNDPTTIAYVKSAKRYLSQFDQEVSR